MTIGNGFTSDFLLDIARGVYPDKEPIFGYGSRTTVGAESGILWGDGAFNINPSANRALEIVSTSAEDANGLTGIRSVEVHYLDSSYTPQLELVVLTGLTPKALVAVNVRFVQYVHIVAFGSVKAAVGNISIREIGTGNIYNYIPIGETASTSSFRMVPSGKKLIVVGAVAGATSGAGNGQVEIAIAGTEIYTHSYINPPVFIDYAELASQNSTHGQNFIIPFVLNELNIFTMKYETDKAAIITGTWYGFFENK